MLMIHGKKFILNRSIWITSTVLCSILAVSGIHHGIFEVLQNGKVIDSFIIQSVGPEQQRWMNGEEAFSILSSYLVTGISSIVVSVAIIIWSFLSLHKNYGPPIMIVLFILLTLVGGGVGFILFYIPVCILAFRIPNQMFWKGREHSRRLTEMVSGIWPYSLLFTCLFFLVSLETSLFGIQGRSATSITAVIYISMIFSAIFMLLTYFSAIIRDIYSETKELTGSN